MAKMTVNFKYSIEKVSDPVKEKCTEDYHDFNQLNGSALLACRYCGMALQIIVEDDPDASRS